MRKLSVSELNRLSTDDFKKSDKLSVTIVLDNIRSMHNIGSIFRSADAFRIEAIHLCGITAQPPHRDIHKTALGATETVHWKYFKSTRDSILELRNKHYTIIVIEQTTESILLNDFVPQQNMAIVFGNEIDGVSEEVVSLCDKSVEIPQAGTKHSLNVSVCAGIVLWSFFYELFE